MKIGLIMLSMLVLSSCGIEDDYFGEEKPLDIPIVFAEGVISLEENFEYPCTFSREYDEFFYGAMDKDRNRFLMHVKKGTDNKWRDPEFISFTGLPEMEPILSPDSDKLFFSASLNETGKPSELYFVEREDEGWGEPVRLPSSINSTSLEYFASISDSGNIYFTREGKGIFVSNFDGRKYLEAEKIKEFEGHFYASHPFISSDEQFIIFDSRKFGGFGSADLYISFRTTNGFSEPINLGENINSEWWDAMASLSPDGKYLFFVRETFNERDIYWVEFNADSYK
ncbi:hypothetical protein RI065_10785 [Mycoplasmatota bacterium zrk1]